MLLKITNDLSFKPIFFAILFCIVFTGGCGLDGGRSLEEIKESGKLIILTQNTPTVYFYDSNEQPSGFEYEMAEAFAKQLGVETEYKVLHTVHEILSSLEKGEGDLASAGLTKTAVRSNRFLFGPVYEKVHQQIVCHKGIKKSGKLSDFSGLKITVPKNSSYAENLANLNRVS